MKKLLAFFALAACSSFPDTSEVSSNATYSSSAAGGGTSGTGNRSVSITSVANTLLVTFASVSGNTQTAPTMTDSQGGAYTLVGQAYWSGGANNMFAFVRTSLVTSAVATTLTLNTNTNTAAEIEVLTFAGMTKTGTAAVKQIVSHGNLPASTLASIVFPSNVTTTDATIVAVASGDYTGIGTDPPVGWTERRDTYQTAPITALEVATKNNGFTGTTITYNGTQDTSFAEMGIELDNSTGVVVDAGVDAPHVDAAPDAALADASSVDAGTITFAHGMVEQVNGTGSNPAQITRDTQASGSTFIVASGGNTTDVNRGPTDNKSNVYTLIGGNDYADWPGSGVYVWAHKNATGGAATTWSQFVTTGSENGTFAIEVPNAGVNPTIISSEMQHDNSGVYSPWLTGNVTLTSSSVTTTGPATLVAFWWGAGPTSWGDVVASVNNGFTIIDGYGIDNPNGELQAEMAYKTVAGAGTYDVTWTYKPVQGAILWLVAVQP